MEDCIVFLTKFSQSLRNEVLDYYTRTHLYLKDLVSYKNIDLTEETLKSNKEDVRNNFLLILKAVKTGLNTIGVPIPKLSKIQNDYLKELEEQNTELLNYGAFLDFYLNKYINKILFEILVDYLLNSDTKKIETLKLFKLVPHGFIDKLDEFKETYINSKTRTFFTFPDIEENLNLTDLSINIKSLKESPKKNIKHNMKEEKEQNKGDASNKEKPDILAQLQEAKKDSIETLKKPKEKLSSPPAGKLEDSIKKEKPKKEMEYSNLPPNSTTQNNLLRMSSIKRELARDDDKTSFLNAFGNLPTVDRVFLNKIRIDIPNLINSRVVNPDFSDLETTFYYISVLRMLGIDFPFPPVEILDFLRNFISGMTFSCSRNMVPDAINIFYGLSIIAELNILHRTNIISLNATEEVLKSELQDLMPEKLKSNYYALLGLQLLAKSEILITREATFKSKLLNFNILQMKEFNPTLDIFHYLCVLKLIDKELNLSNLYVPYINELKKFLNSRGSIGNLISDSARTLLILDLLNLKKQESVLCSRLLNYILTFTDFFSLQNLENDFSWRIDKLAYKVELKMLFWVLLACSQYSPDNLIKL